MCLRRFCFLIEMRTQIIFVLCNCFLLKLCILKTLYILIPLILGGIIKFDLLISTFFLGP